MKKLVLFAAAAAMVALASCGGSKNAECADSAAVDSAVVVDSVAADSVVADSTVAAVADSAVVAE